MTRNELDRQARELMQNPRKYRAKSLKIARKRAADEVRVAQRPRKVA